MNPAVVNAGQQAVDLSMRLLAHRLVIRARGPASFSVSQVGLFRRSLLLLVGLFCHVSRAHGPASFSVSQVG